MSCNLIMPVSCSAINEKENSTISNGTRGANSGRCVKSFIAHTCARTQISDFSLNIFKFIKYLTKFKGLPSYFN